MANIIRLDGGTGGGSVLITKSITQNGNYNATDDGADGYSSVSVSVSGGGGNFTPISWANETHNVQSNRTITISQDGYTLNSPISSQTQCVGVLSMPITLPTGANYLFLTYDLVGTSYSSTTYYATIFASDSQVTTITDKTGSYGNKQLVQKALSAGASLTGNGDGLGGSFLPSGSSFYFNLQFGISNMQNIKLFAVTV